MKILKIIKNKKFYKKERNSFYLEYNKEVLENMDAISFASHHETYKVLRNYKTLFYNKCYFFRNKKGFNTFFFEQKYDIVITNKNNIIIETIIEFAKGTVSKHYENSFNIFFFIPGSINNYNFEKKGELLIRSKMSRLLLHEL